MNAQVVFFLKEEAITIGPMPLAKAEDLCSRAQVPGTQTLYRDQDGVMSLILASEIGAAIVQLVGAR